MGNVEKWVVLGVLGLIIGILVVSLNVDDPLKKDKVVLAGGKELPNVASLDTSKPQPAKTDPGPVAGKATTPAILDSIVDTNPPESDPKIKPAPAAPQIPSGSILKTMDGLQDSYMTDAMFYTWKTGDTFPLLAQRFYGDASRLATLKRLNEGRTDVQPGERILIPVFDLDAVQTPTLASVPVAVKAGSIAPKPDVAAKSSGGKTESPLSAASSSAGPRFHLVKDGESLWKIAKQELGSGSRWNEIYTANRDLLSSPEALHTGQKLRVP